MAEGNFKLDFHQMALSPIDDENRKGGRRKCIDEADDDHVLFTQIPLAIS